MKYMALCMTVGIPIVAMVIARVTVLSQHHPKTDLIVHLHNLLGTH